MRDRRGGINGYPPSGLRRLAGEITPALTSRVIGAGLAQAVSVLAKADGLIVSTPVCNAGPSGLLISLFQAIEDDLLIAKPVLLAATAASARHALVVDDQMRPMFAYLRALTVPTSPFRRRRGLDRAGVGRSNRTGRNRAGPPHGQRILTSRQRLPGNDIATVSGVAEDRGTESTSIRT